MSRGRWSVYGIGLAVAAVILASPLGAQSQGSANAKAPAPMPNFTGIVTSADASDLRASRLKYEAGARSFWHAHDGDLVLLVEQGRGRAQVKGQKIREFGPGEPIYLPANVPHWHGAAPKEGLTWIALSVNRNATVMNPVTDEEYLGTAK